MAVEDVERVDRHGCDGARSPVSGISRLTWDVVRTMRCSSGEVRAELPCGGRALVGPLARYQGTGITGTTDPGVPRQQSPRPATATATHAYTPTHTRHPNSAMERSPVPHTNQWPQLGLSRAVILHIAGSVGSRLQPYRSRIRTGKGCTGIRLGARIPACLWLRWPSLRPSSPRGSDEKRGS